MREKKSCRSWTIMEEFAVLSGANTHDVKLLEETLEHIVMLRPEPDEEHPQNLCLDAGYAGSGKVQERGYTPHIRPRGEERKELERNPEFHVRHFARENFNANVLMGRFQNSEKTPADPAAVGGTRNRRP